GSSISSYHSVRGRKAMLYPNQNGLRATQVSLHARHPHFSLAGRNRTTRLAGALIRRRSVNDHNSSRQDKLCIMILAGLLERYGFRVYIRQYGFVYNLVAVHGKNGPCLVLLGHTDVVPEGEGWDQHCPFEPEIVADQEGVEWLCGRGAKDMKGPL